MSKFAQIMGSVMFNIPLKLSSLNVVLYAPAVRKEYIYKTAVFW